MKYLIHKAGSGLLVMLLSLAMISPAMAQSSTQLTLVTGKLISVNSTTLPAQLTLQVKGQATTTVVVGVSDKTIFLSHSFEKVSLSSLMTGDTLQVFGRYDENGILQALSVKDQSLKLKHRTLTGTISTIEPFDMTFTLSPRAGFSSKLLPVVVQVTSNTKIMSTNGKTLSFSDLKFSEQATVTGMFNSRTNILVASHVRVKVTKPQPLPFSLRGELTAISSTTLPASLTMEVTGVLPPLTGSLRSLLAQPVNMVTFKVDSNTKITETSGATITLADLKVGDDIVMQGNIDAGGNITATTVRDNSVGVVSSTAKGNVQSVDPFDQTFVLVKDDGSTMNVAVHGSTIFNVPGMTTSVFADIKVGDNVRVEGALNTRTNVLTANIITVLNVSQPLPFSFKGKLTAMSGRTLPAMLTVEVSDILPPLNGMSVLLAPPINSVTFRVDANTDLTSKNGVGIDLGNFTLGDTLVVQGNMGSGGNITATLVRDDSVVTTAGPISGSIQTINTTTQSFIFRTSTGAVYTAQVYGDTQLIVPGVSNPTFANLHVGNMVGVEGVLNLDNSVIQSGKVTVTATTTTQ
ncbi:MAG: hypothetical protein G01um101413_297 [Parcubacteria group bacterium Gr01-1014_13]|nr:MAG: hypothetical protein G01um101413_297 [Parcubacteria group bacterium Gr01-1014_13]